MSRFIRFFSYTFNTNNFIKKITKSNMKKIKLIALLLLVIVFGVQAQHSNKEIILSDVVAGSIHGKLSKDGKAEVFSITVVDEDHSCVVDFCGFSYNNKNKTYKHNIEVLNNNIKEVLSTLDGEIESCAVLKYEGKGIKFTVYGIAPTVAYICVDGHGHGILSKEDLKAVTNWIDSLKIK